MRRWMIYGLVFAMVWTSFAVMDVGAEKTDSRLLTTPDGLSWADPIQITTNNVDDMYPTLVVDSAANAHIMYYQNNADFKYQKIQRPGKRVIGEQYIVSGNMPTQHSWYSSGTVEPTERIGIDGEENIHVVWTSGSYYGGNYYQKFSNTGKPLSQVIDPSPSTSSPQLPYLGVGKNNCAYVGSEQEGGGEHGELTRIDTNLNTMMVDVESYTEGVALVVDQWNNDVIHFFTNRWSGGSSIHHSKWSAALGQLVAPHTMTDIPSSGGSSSPMPTLSTTPNGHVHLLVGDTRNSPRTLYYVELDPMGNQLGNALQVTTNAVDFGDIVGDGNNDVYVIWGASDGHVYYMKILEGKEQASLQQQPIKISAGLNGVSSRPQFGVDPDNGLHVVFVNNGDGDNEIYYRYAYTFGVELKMSPQEQAHMMFIHPAEVKSANITVKNVGGQNDTMFLNISIDFMGHEGQGWDAWLDEDELDLDPSETQKVVVYVRGPDYGNPNDFIETCINATSMRNPEKNDSACFRTFLIVDHNIKLDIADNVHVTMAGEPTEFTGMVRNLGDVAEDVKLVIEEQPYDWDVELSEDFFAEVQPKDSKTFTLTVTPPKGALANEVGSVTLKAFVQSMPTVKDIATAHTVVKPNVFIKLSVGEDTKYITPGNQTDYTIVVSNKGNMPGTVVIILEIVSGTGDWNVRLDRTSVAVPTNGEQEVTMTVIAPESAMAGDRLVVRVQGTDEARTMSDSVTTTTIVKQVHDIDITTSPPEIKVRPGETANYDVTVANHGNGPEKLILSAKELPAGWNLSFLDEGVPISEVVLQPGESKTYSAAVMVPGSALAGKYTNIGTLKTGMGDEFEFAFDTVVAQIFEIDLSTAVSKQVGAPGENISFPLQVRNLGNGVDTITLSVEDKPSNWNYDFMLGDDVVSSVTLDPGATETLTLVFQIPRDTEVPEDGFTITASAVSSGSTTDKVKFVVPIQLSNLAVGKVTMEKGLLVPDKPVTIEIEVLNTGNVDTDNVEVYFYDGKTLVDNKTLGRMPAGATKTVTFTWLPSAGMHKLKFKVDPNDHIVELDEGDNEASKNVAVRSPNAITPGFEPTAVFMAVAVLALLLLRRRRE